MSRALFATTEALAFARTAIERMRAQCLGLNPAFDPLVETAAQDLELRTNALATAWERRNTPRALLQYERDHLDRVHLALSQLTSLLKSRPNAKEQVDHLLDGRTVSETRRLRPQLRLEAASRAVAVFTAMAIPGGETLLAELTTARDELRLAIEQVRTSDTETHQILGQLKAAQAEWDASYRNAKRTVKGVLFATDRMDLLDRVFEDLVRKAS